MARLRISIIRRPTASVIKSIDGQTLRLPPIPFFYMSLASPEKLPAIILPECTLLPQCVLPLHIFEERYRSMITKALNTDRLFAVACKRPDASSLIETENVYPLGCAGFIRACVTNPDGTSNLMIQGTQRIRFKQWDEQSNYPLATVEWIANDESCKSAETEITRQLLDIIDEMISDDDQAAIAMLKHLRSLDDGGTVADLVAYHFLGGDHQLLRKVLGAFHCCDRLALVFETLTSVNNGLK